MRTRRTLVLAFAIGLVPMLGACGDRDDSDVDVVPPASEATTAQTLSVTDVELGRSIDAQGRITVDAGTDDFTASETIYVSVSTMGSAAGSTLTARWTYQDGQVVDESSQNISPTGPATTEFHISNPGGFPAGTYTVEIMLNGSTVETKEFEVN